MYKIKSTHMKLIVFLLFVLLTALYVFRPQTEEEKKIIHVFENIEDSSIEEIVIIKVFEPKECTIKISNKKIIGEFLSSLNGKVKVIGHGPRMKDHYIISLRTNAENITFHFTKRKTQNENVCRYGFVFYEVVNSLICNELYLSQNSLQPVNAIEEINLRPYVKGSSYSSEKLALFIEKYVDTRINTKGKKIIHIY